MSVKALFFDVFGTLVDWRSGVAREAESILGPAGHKLDWVAFADAWRDEYQPAMEEVRAGRMAFCKLDVLHRQNLDRILPRFGISGLAEDAARNLNLAWHRLDAWPDVPGGLARLKRRFLLAPVSNGNISLMVDLARRNNFPWDAILGAEIAGDYKPKPRVYLAACEAFDLPPADCMMVAAHTNDLLHAAKCGLRTAHVARPNEHGPGIGEAAPEAPVDVAATISRISPPNSAREARHRAEGTRHWRTPARSCIYYGGASLRSDGMADPVSQFATRIAYGARQLPRVAWYIGHGMVMRRLSQAVRERAGQKPRPQARVNVPDRRRLYADMAVLFQRDLANVEAGIYPLPADHDGALPVLLARSRLFFEDLPDVHRRRERRDIRQVLTEDTRGKRPNYYLQNFHFQSGGWLTPELAQRYDTQVEVLFNGSANAMRRQALVPLHEIFAGRDQRRLKLLDVGCGTGRFLDFIQAGLAAPAGRSASICRRPTSPRRSGISSDGAGSMSWSRTGKRCPSGAKPGCGDEHLHVARVAAEGAAHRLSRVRARAEAGRPTGRHRLAAGRRRAGLRRHARTLPAESITSPTTTAISRRTSARSPEAVASPTSAT